ncbi:hypothetical protein ACJJIQ_07295 [Microbulbifer sp. ANSA003]|uniref:hypothetical protein n=1 Tax=unclassified Microbulbifer TaxID=2619833 RepID=UPI002B2CBD70|nr:hypothetical protein QT397_14380 [Microbulbifer sp. MKSA007]
MAITVHVWKQKTGNVGHASITIDNTYISYWPSSAAGKKDFKIGRSHSPSFPSGYRVDRRLEGGDADQNILIDGLNETKMIEAWENFKGEQKHYNMKDQNCSTVVAWLLETGSGFASPGKGGIKISDWAASPIHRILFQLRFFGNHIDMWTPNDVLAYALQIRSQITS